MLRAVHTITALANHILRRCRAPVLCTALALAATLPSVAGAQSTRSSGAAGVAVIAPPQSISPSRNPSPLVAQGSGTGSMNLSEPPRQLFSSAPPGTFDPYAMSPSGPVLVAPSSGPSNTGVFSGLSGGLFGGDAAYEQAIWDDVAGIYAPNSCHDWSAQLLPDGLVYRSYLAGVKESRLSSVFNNDSKAGWIWDITLGGRAGIFRYGTTNAVRPEGFQIDIEGSGQPRLDLGNNEDLVAADFRGGVPITYGIGRWQSKFAYYHLSSHVGDEYLVSHPGFQRINYSRDALVLGQSYYLTADWRIYGEAGWAFYSDVSEPWEFQFGTEYSPVMRPGIGGAPFAAFNVQSRQELDFRGNIVLQAGWQWRARNRGHLFRVGLQYYNGKNQQFEFYQVNENKVGIGLWYDF